jgi:predicted site-specific integrase-resolvase
MQAMNGHDEAVERLDPPTHEEDPILNLTEVARQLGKHPTTIKQWCIDGLLIAIKLPSGLYGVRKSEVNKFLGGSALQQQVS